MEPRAGLEPATYSFLELFVRTRLLLYRLSYRGTFSTTNKPSILKLLSAVLALLFLWFFLP